MDNFLSDDVRVFLSVARLGHVRAAARELKMSASTAHRRLRQFERAVKGSVFFRTPSGLRPTERGTQLIPMAETLEAKALDFERATRLVETDVVGTVRISAPELFSSHVLLPSLPTLRNQLPQVAFQLQMSNRTSSFSRRETDIALRLNRPEESSVYARRLGFVGSGLVASRKYLQRRGEPQKATLSAHELVWDDVPNSIEARWKQQHASHATLALTCSSAQGRLAAVKAGLGISFLPNYVWQADIDILPCRELPLLPNRELWMLVHRDERQRISVRQVASALKTLLVPWSRVQAE